MLVQPARPGEKPVIILFPWAEPSLEHLIPIGELLWASIIRSAT